MRGQVLGDETIPQASAVAHCRSEQHTGSVSAQSRDSVVRESAFSSLSLPPCCLMIPWCYAFLVKCPPWKVIFVTINVMDAGDTTCKRKCFHLSVAISSLPGCTLQLARICLWSLLPNVNLNWEESLALEGNYAEWPPVFGLLFLLLSYLSKERSHFLFFWESGCDLILTEYNNGEQDFCFSHPKPSLHRT